MAPWHIESSVTSQRGRKDNERELATAEAVTEREAYNVYEEQSFYSDSSESGKQELVEFLTHSHSNREIQF
eukprot:CAMPEP_0184670710 /NCGR_PEP_ID=MMETSP0308-20130426/83457_1 /TAXON_ID=38269 /ORGANISM="Gloeochaete witrockiana, Strain SAG 46.84" /LENGTH=70 /DNA_ID=CAMNT_0027117559 /DNA_START=127 /DNA_END=339 /DNA_ORIENTATION=+